jgi:purine-binding chemotaxis protein CheW
MLSSPDFPNLATDEADISSVLPQKQSAGDFYLRFFVESGEEFAFPAMDIREVLSLAVDQITPVPNISPVLMGVINFRGQVVWIADAGQFFLENAKPINTDRLELSVLVVETQDLMVGFAIEQVKGMEWMGLENLFHSANTPDSLATLMKGECPGEHGKSVYVLDSAAIVRSMRWAA